MTKKYQSEQLMVCHEDAEAMRRLGILSDAEMREFDKDCLVPEPKTLKKTHQRPTRLPIGG
jgi:DNA-binding transcriptional regulator YiaG